jgi:hypothetical protein
MIAYRANISSSYADSIESSTFASGVVQMFKTGWSLLALH